MFLWLFNIIVGVGLATINHQFLHLPAFIDQFSFKKTRKLSQIINKRFLNKSHLPLTLSHLTTGSHTKQKKTTYIQLSILHPFPSSLGLQDLPVFRSKGISTSVFHGWEQFIGKNSVNNQRQGKPYFLLCQAFVIPAVHHEKPQNNMVLYKYILDYTASFVSIRFKQ